MARKKSKKIGKKRNFLDKKISRREFIKKGILALASLGIGAYALDSILKRSIPLSTTFKGEAPQELWKWSKEAYHYIKLGNNVQCLICPNQCILEENDRSICRVKVNKNGKLYTLAYGNPCAVHVDPIEKKPLFHFLPGTKAFSIATAGCNFRCLNCQNWQISQSKPEETRNVELFPKDVVHGAINTGSKSIAYTYSEPIAFYEYMYDTAKIAKSKGIKNLWITNGYINKEALLDLCKYLDAANVDLKSFKEEIYNKLNSGRLQPVLNTLKTLKNQKVWFEITNLIVPTYTDDFDMIREMCKWIVNNLGPDYPVHFSRFMPMYKLTYLPPTPIGTLEKAIKIAQEEGIKFAYIGNVPGHKAENTYCPKCGKIVIDRTGYKINEYNIENNACKFCGEKIVGVWIV
jgi:pyruvate formate lyase activating enzyme